MSIFNFFRKKTNPSKTDQPEISMKIMYEDTNPASIQVQTQDKTEQLEIEYVRLSTSGDENVCPMCAQFEGKIFLATDAPQLPLCPSCACAYEYYLKEDLPPDAVISDKNDFVLPAECAPAIYQEQQQAYETDDIKKCIRICQKQLKQLHEFMAPYLSAKFSAPSELACRDLLPDLYMKLGEWKKAEKAIKSCISANAYYPNDGSEQLADFEAYRKIATTVLSYISDNPGCLQRNIYKALPYEGADREYLKYFLRSSLQITKEKSGNTNKLYVKEG